MRQGVLFSALLHLTVLVLFLVGPFSFSPQADLAPPIPIEIISALDLSEPEPEPEPVAELPPPAPKPIPIAPEPEPEPVVEPEPEPEVAELEPVPEPEPEPLVEPEPEPEPEPEEKLAEIPPKPVRKPQTQVAMADEKEEEEPPPPEDRLTSILRNVDKLRDQASEKETQVVERSQSQTARPVSVIEQMTMIRTIQRQMARCWQIEPGARDAESLVVEIRVVLNPDATVRDAQIIDFQRMFSDSFFRSAAENARRAIFRCSPFELPANKYQVWREMTLKFDPRRMFGG